MKFHELGYHPVEDRRLNLIEQVNQTFTYLVSLAAAEYILNRHPGAAPICLNLGTAAGSDLESASQSVAAEVFASVRRTNNRKLDKDVAKVATSSAAHKYVFYYCPGEDCTPPRIVRFPDVEINDEGVGAAVQARLRAHSDRAFSGSGGVWWCILTAAPPDVGVAAALKGIAR